MSVRSREMREEAGRFVAEARALVDRAEAGVMTEENSAKFDKLHAEAEQRIQAAERLERQERADASVEETARQVAAEQVAAVDGPVNPRATPEYARAFNQFLRRGMDRVAPDVRGALQIDSDIGGGFITASEIFLNKLIQAVDDAVPVRARATGFNVGLGETLGAPSLEGDLSEFSWGGGELTEAVEDTGITFGKRELKPRLLVRKVVKVSRALIENPRIDAEAIVTGRAAYKLSATLERAYMSGLGADRPLGLFVASDDGIGTGRDVVTGSATDITADGLINIQGTLKPQYQTKSEWLFHRDAITRIRKLKDGNGQYLWQPGIRELEPNTILGKRYLQSEFVPNTFTSGNYVGIYGDLSFYWYVDQASLRIQRLVEKYATTGQIGLLFDNLGGDGMPVLAEAFVRAKCGT